MRVRSLLLSTSILCAALVTADTVALAQSDVIETVTVTARRMAESIQNTPVSVTALDAKALEKLYVHNLQDLTRSAPNFTIEGVGAVYRTSAVIYSRGIGYQGVDAAIEPSVGVAIDGLFLPSNIGTLQSMFDLAQVELLRGPQGTLFGKNTTAGVVQITTADPTDQYELSAKLRYGNFGRQDYYLTANVPLTDTLDFRLAVMNQHSDGIWTNTYTNPTTGLPTNRHTGGDDTKALRGKLKWTPNENLTVKLTGQYFRQRQDAAAGQNGSVALPRTSAGVGVGDLLANPPYNRPGIGYAGGPTDPFRISRDNNGQENLDEWFGILSVDYRTPYGFDVISLTSALRYSSRLVNDYDATDLPYFLSTSGEAGAAQKMFSQEVRLQSNDEDSRLNWQAGLWYYNHNWYSTQYNYVMISVPPAPFAFIKQGAITAQNAYTLAGYFHADYEIVDNLTLSGGARYSYENKSFGRRPTAVGLALTKPLAPFTLTPSADWKDFTFDVGAKYRINDNAMVYASYSTGAKAGGFNSGGSTATNIGPFKPETAKAIEIGAKTDWFEKRLRVNMAAFWNEYDELQIGAFRSTGVGATLESFVANSAVERARGVELEIAAVPFENLNVSAAIGYLDARYTSFKTDLQYIWPGHPCRAGSAAQIAAGTADYLVGTTVDHAAAGACYLVPSRVPQWSGKFDISYDVDLKGHGKLTPHVSFSFESSHYTNTNNAPQGLQPTYSIVDADLNWTDPSERYSVSIWGKNVFNQLHMLNSNAISNLFSINYYADPATFGIDLSIKFGGEK